MRKSATSASADANGRAGVRSPHSTRSIGAVGVGERAPAEDAGVDLISVTGPGCPGSIRFGATRDRGRALRCPLRLRRRFHLEADVVQPLGHRAVGLVLGRDDDDRHPAVAQVGQPLPAPLSAGLSSKRR